MTEDGYDFLPASLRYVIADGGKERQPFFHASRISPHRRFFCSYLSRYEPVEAPESEDEPDEAYLVLETRSKEMLRKKQAFVKGQWNTNSIQVKALGSSLCLVLL